VLRSIFVVAFSLVGVAYAFRAPVYGLMFYLWTACFRPEEWVWVASIVTIAAARESELPCAS
jgi:hypothetical protein